MAKQPGGRSSLSRRIIKLIAIASLLSIATRQTQAFDLDKLYKYEFQGAITTRVSDDDRSQYSGVALTTPVLVKKTASDELTVSLDKPQIATFNDLIEEIHHYKFDFKPIDASQSVGLDRAFRIYFDGESGAVKSFDSHKDEPKWVTNFKRGLLSFFQLKLKTPSDAQQSQEPGSSPATSLGNKAALNANRQYYSTSEKSVFGECETDYLVMLEPLSGPEASQTEQQFAMNVTKTRNMARCKSKFLHRFMPIDSSECYENEKELQQYKHSNAIFNYDLIGTRQNYVIQQVLVDETTTYAPFGQNAIGHLVHSKFMMKLLEVDANSNRGDGPQADDSVLTRLESLSYDPPEMMNFYANVNLEQEHHLSSILQSSANVDQVMAAFEALVQEHRSYGHTFDLSDVGAAKSLEKSRLAELFTKLNELVGTLNLQQIEQLYAQVDERGEAYKKIFWDLMSVAGTNPSFVYMKRLITDGDAPSVKIKDFLARLSFHIKMPSKSLFDEYVNLCKSDKIQTNSQYKRICSLPLASLIHQHCAKPHAKFMRMQQDGVANSTAYKRGQNTCQIATAEEYFTRLVAPFSSGTGSGDNELSIGEKMFNIKLAGELGVKPSADYLMDVVARQQEHPVLRSAAMWQLYKVARIYPNQIKRLVVPYFHDRNELLELRLAAFHNWLATGLSLHEMETMAKQLMSEPSRQLVIYVHSLVSSMAKLQPIPCAHSSERHARLVMPTINKALARHAPPALTDSQAKLTSTWQQDYGYGTTNLMSVIFSNESMAPSNLYYSSSEIMTGLKLTPMSVSVQAHGLDKLVKRVVGINGLLADKESLMDVFSLKRRSKRQVTADLIKEEAQEIDKELKLVPRDFSDVYVSMTISAYGRPITFHDRDSRELKKMLSDDGTIKIPAVKKLLHSFNNHTIQQMVIGFEKLEVFNNEMGLPLYQSISDFDYKILKINSVKLDVEPGFFRDERQGKPPTKFSLNLDSKFGRDNEMLVSTGSIVASTKQQVGVGFHKKKLLNIPLKMALDVNLAQNQITIKRQPIHENILYIKQTPVTFIKSYDPAKAVREPSTSPEVANDEWRPLFMLNNSAQMKPFILEQMTPLALGLRLEGKHRAGQDWSFASWRRHLSNIGLSAAKFTYFYSPNGHPLEARLSTYTTKENPTRELVELFSWRHHHRDTPTSSADLNEVEKELESATRGQGTNEGPPSTVSYKVSLVGGSTKERRVDADLSYSRSFDKLLHKWRAFYSRTPSDQTAPNSETTNLCMLGQLQFPKHTAAKLLDFELDQLDYSANLSSEISFGDECQESKVVANGNGPRVSARVTFDWTVEQRQAIEWALGLQGKLNEVHSHSSDEFDFVDSASGEPKRNVYAQLYRKCLAKREVHGAKLEPSCLELLRKVGELTHISAQFDYKDVPERWTKIVRFLGSLYTYARAGYIEEMDDKPPGPVDYYKSTDGIRDRAHLEANISTLHQGNERKLTYEFDTPNYHVMYKNVPMPPIPPLSTFPLLGSSFYQQVLSKTGSMRCLVSNRTVSTFDKYTYEMPQVGDGCFKLIAKDCSPEANFVVLGAKVGQTGKVVKVYISQKFKVEFVPDKDGKRISDIKVNGETVQIEQDKPALRRDTKLGSKTMEAFSIDYNGAYYTLNSKLYKFSVSTDGTWILIQQSKYYSGKSCGLCGDANGDHLLEFGSPRKQVCKNTSDFVWSYVLPSTCASRPTNIECA